MKRRRLLVLNAVLLSVAERDVRRTMGISKAPDDGHVTIASFSLSLFLARFSPTAFLDYDLFVAVFESLQN